MTDWDTHWDTHKLTLVIGYDKVTGLYEMTFTFDKWTSLFYGTHHFIKQGDATIGEVTYYGYPIQQAYYRKRRILEEINK